jgi:hypothetical protein
VYRVLPTDCNDTTLVLQRLHKLAEDDKDCACDIGDYKHLIELISLCIAASDEPASSIIKRCVCVMTHCDIFGYCHFLVICMIECLTSHIPALASTAQSIVHRDCTCISLRNKQCNAQSRLHCIRPLRINMSGGTHQPSNPPHPQVDTDNS